MCVDMNEYVTKKEIRMNIRTHSDRPEKRGRQSRRRRATAFSLMRKPEALCFSAFAFAFACGNGNDSLEKVTYLTMP